MSRVPGLKFEKDAKGNNRYVRIDLKKHNTDLLPFLIKVGAVPSVSDEPDDEFEREWGTGLTGEQVKAELYAFIDTLPWKK